MYVLQFSKSGEGAPSRADCELSRCLGIIFNKVWLVMTRTICNLEYLWNIMCFTLPFVRVARRLGPEEVREEREEVWRWSVTAWPT